ncbi:hypothetical protein AFK68_28005 [Hydrocoleum sp. CS-953]|nr:hypothetical protein AFK68_28005 [Hydrocoleum sp. CS-953]
MNTPQINSNTVELLSRLGGKKLSPENISFSVVFLASLVTVLLGIMFADGTVTDEEEKIWETTIVFGQ